MTPLAYLRHVFEVTGDTRVPVWPRRWRERAEEIARAEFDALALTPGTGVSTNAYTSRKRDGSPVATTRNGIDYTRELSDLICARLASGRTLRSVCRDDGMPSRESVRRWVLADIDGFGERFKNARLLGYEEMADEVLDIPDGVEQDKDAINRARLRVDTRKWVLSKALPKVYGERVVLAGDKDAPLTAPQQPGPNIEEMMAIAAAKVRK